MAIENIEAILDVPGIDGIYVGPRTCPSPYGMEPKLDVEDKFVLGIYDKLLKETGKRGHLAAGLHTGSAKYAPKRMFDMGFKLGDHQQRGRADGHGGARRGRPRRVGKPARSPTSKGVLLANATLPDGRRHISRSTEGGSPPSSGLG